MKYIRQIALLAAFASTGARATANEQVSVRDRVAQFLTNNVMGRVQSIVTKGKLTDEGQEYVIDFEAKIRWTGMQLTETGLIFDEIRDVKQTNTKIDAQGNPIGAPEETTRQVSHRYAVSERATTGSLVGLTTVTKNTEEESTGLGYVTMIEISPDNSELYIYTSLNGFVERSLDGVNIRPVATATSATMYLGEGGKLLTDETVKFYKVDINNDFARQEINRFNLTANEVSN